MLQEIGLSFSLFRVVAKKWPKPDAPETRCLEHYHQSKQGGFVTDPRERLERKCSSSSNRLVINPISSKESHLNPGREQKEEVILLLLFNHC